MLQTAPVAPLRHPEWSPVPEDAIWEDNSPFGLQGLARETLQILKPECVTPLAVSLALRATPEQIRDDDYVNRLLSWHPEWIDEYQVVHLIEKSLWIQGHSDLVMTMLRNPSQIPDNPPRKILDALSRAYTLHPDSSIWYGVPLFGNEKNEDGLPIPVTASEVKLESQNRINAARQHALRWGWFFRSALMAARVPAVCWQVGMHVRNRVQSMSAQVSSYWRRSKQGARIRARAMIQAELERCRFGYALTEIPEHRTWLSRGMESTALILELMAFRASQAGSIASTAAPFLSALGVPMAMATYIPVLFIPLPIVLCDPFLFVELPEEPGKLRHLGHWYWQQQANGQQKLHLHV